MEIDKTSGLTAHQWGKLANLASAAEDQELAKLCSARRNQLYVAEHESAKQSADEGTCRDEDLVYASHARCLCGAGFAYPVGIGAHGFWDCSDIMTGRAPVKGTPDSRVHSDRKPFVFWDIKSENQPSADGATTRPEKAAVEVA
jgi:hypothetical protein